MFLNKQKEKKINHFTVVLCCHSANMFTIVFVYFTVYLVGGITEYNPPDTVFPEEHMNFVVDFKNARKLTRFWTNTGLCPPAPTNDSLTLAEFFLSEKSIQNMEYISTLPNNGLKVIRIHWLLNLIKFV